MSAEGSVRANSECSGDFANKWRGYMAAISPRGGENADRSMWMWLGRRHAVKRIAVRARRHAAQTDGCGSEVPSRVVGHRATRRQAARGLHARASRHEPPIQNDRADKPVEQSRRSQCMDDIADDRVCVHGRVSLSGVQPCKALPSRIILCVSVVDNVASRITSSRVRTHTSQDTPKPNRLRYPALALR